VNAEYIKTKLREIAYLGGWVGKDDIRVKDALDYIEALERALAEAGPGPKDWRGTWPENCRKV